ncbi:MAG: hypothetical protein HYV26_08655 [Candidatus Hydrogenedentes bacterium]|nr:hypothetical protein [Candidatus Hydrogenedentota bacterium]
MHVRINITLPESTVQMLDLVSSRGNRSRLIDTAVRQFLKDKSRAELRQRLAEAYRRSAVEDLKIAAEWFPLEEEAWLRESK